MSSVLVIHFLLIDTLMQEQRITERMIPPLKKELSRIEESKDVNVKFKEKAVDFIRIYADRTHHGKEEGLLFRELRKKSMSNEHATLIMGLIEDQPFSRKSTSDLEKANMTCARGNLEAWRDVGSS